jgi:hypothetical protein
MQNNDFQAQSWVSERVRMAWSGIWRICWLGDGRNSVLHQRSYTAREVWQGTFCTHATQTNFLSECSEPIYVKCQFHLLPVQPSHRNPTSWLCKLLAIVHRWWWPASALLIFKWSLTIFKLMYRSYTEELHLHNPQWSLHKFLLLIFLVCKRTW